MDETPRGILKFMEDNKYAMVQMIGDSKYKEEIEVVKKIVEQESKKGSFEAIEGAIDTRP